MKTFTKTRYKGCQIVAKGDIIHVLGPTFIYITKGGPGYLTRATQYIDRRI